MVDVLMERDFSQRESFEPFSYADEKTGAVYASPFAVVVLGIKNQLLGTGSLVGQTRDVFDGSPVIALDDKSAPGGSVEILGIECWWTPIDDSEICMNLIQKLAINESKIMSASDYVKVLDDQHN